MLSTCGWTVPYLAFNVVVGDGGGDCILSRITAYKCQKGSKEYGCVTHKEREEDKERHCVTHKEREGDKERQQQQ